MSGIARFEAFEFDPNGSQSISQPWGSSTRNALKLPRLLLVPIRVRRPQIARQALRRGPLKQAGRADSAGIERVPVVPTSAGPSVVAPRRPVAQRATDARSR